MERLLQCTANRRTWNCVICHRWNPKRNDCMLLSKMVPKLLSMLCSRLDISIKIYILDNLDDDINVLFQEVVLEDKVSSKLI